MYGRCSLALSPSISRLSLRCTGDLKEKKSKRERERGKEREKRREGEERRRKEEREEGKGGEGSSVPC
jgi:hypothetical protein